jgi:hypothetical protein
MFGWLFGTIVKAVVQAVVNVVVTVSIFSYFLNKINMSDLFVDKSDPYFA